MSDGEAGPVLRAIGAWQSDRALARCVDDRGVAIPIIPLMPEPAIAFVAKQSPTGNQPDHSSVAIPLVRIAAGCGISTEPGGLLNGKYNDVFR